MTSVKEMERENLKLKEQVAGLQKRIAELEAQKASATPSKSRQQAEAVADLLSKNGIVSKKELMEINPKYPSDPVYYARSILKVDIERFQGSYFTPEALKTYKAGLEKDKKAKTDKAAEVQTPAAAQTPKEAVRQAAA